MSEISDERQREIAAIVKEILPETDSIGDAIDQLTDRFPDDTELNNALIDMGVVMSIPSREDIVVNAVQMLLSGMNVLDGMDVLTTLISHTIRIVPPAEQIALIDTLKGILDRMTPEMVDPEMN